MTRDVCPRCSKTVYHAEKVLGGGSAWHKKCFKCPAPCNKRLDSSTVAIHEGEAFCKSCHARQFGPKGFGFGQGAGALAETSGSAKVPAQRGGGGGGGGGIFCSQCGIRKEGGNFCPECGNPYPAANGGGGGPPPVPMQAKYGGGGGPPPVPMQANPGPSPPARGIRGGGASVNVGGGNRDACGRCGKTVYHAEKAIGGSKVWHKKCFNCQACKRKLDSTTLREHDGGIFCSTCHGGHFGPKGYGFGGGAGALARTQ